MFPIRSRLTHGLAACLLLAASPLAWSADDGVEQARQAQKGIDDIAQETQARIDDLSDKAQEMLAEYRAARDETENLRIYNEQLQRQIESQEEEIASLEDQLAQIDRTQQEFVPQMLEALNALEQFVERDLPFRIEERRAEIEALRELMGQANVTTAEKYRQLMARFQAEMKYGRTIETYRGELELEGEQRSVRFLRVGRVALMYQTLDQQRTGRWNPAADEWEAVGGAFRAAFEQGYKIAAEQAPPDLVEMPVNAPGGR